MSTVTPETLKQLQDEVFALLSAWLDRGLSPEESAMVLAANAHSTLAELGFSLKEIVELLARGWDGKP